MSDLDPQEDMILFFLTTQIAFSTLANHKGLSFRHLRKNPIFFSPTAHVLDQEQNHGALISNCTKQVSERLRDIFKTNLLGLLCRQGKNRDYGDGGFPKIRAWLETAPTVSLQLRQASPPAEKLLVLLSRPQAILSGSHTFLSEDLNLCVSQRQHHRTMSSFK